MFFVTKDTNKFCSSESLVKVMAYVFIFIHIIRNKEQGTRILERRASFQFYIVQQKVYCSEIHKLKNQTPINKHSNTMTLHPFLDSNDMLCIRSRPQHLSFPYNNNHQFILSSNHHLTRLIIVTACKGITCRSTINYSYTAGNILNLSQYASGTQLNIIQL
jgi:hypothetical protein